MTKTQTAALVIFVFVALVIVYFVVDNWYQLTYSKRKTRMNYYNNLKKSTIRDCAIHENQSTYSMTFDSFKKYYIINHDKWRLWEFPTYTFFDEEKEEEVYIYCILDSYEDFEKYVEFKENDAVYYNSSNPEHITMFIEDLQSDIDKSRKRVLASLEEEYKRNAEIINRDFPIKREEGDT